jgi:hypothetical protein
MADDGSELAVGDAGAKGAHVTEELVDPSGGGATWARARPGSSSIALNSRSTTPAFMNDESLASLSINGQMTDRLQIEQLADGRLVTKVIALRRYQ